jgi:hypothetical protein
MVVIINYLLLIILFTLGKFRMIRNIALKILNNEQGMINDKGGTII